MKQVTYQLQCRICLAIPQTPSHLRDNHAAVCSIGRSYIVMRNQSRMGTAGCGRTVRADLWEGD